MVVNHFIKHCKMYEVLDTVRHSETCEPMTLYRALYGEHGLWVRPSAMFLEEIEIKGVLQPRFARVAEGTGSDFARRDLTR